jgi:cellulose synthase/poly-beta-1,6-N-acetylglucosamine synthase-like glycosyltransferase
VIAVQEIEDPRLAPPTWRGEELSRPARLRATALAIGSTVALVLYFRWLLQPDRVGNPVLFALLVAAELFNVTQALGFWWTCLAGRRRRPWPAVPDRRRPPTVDVFIPTYNEPVDVVEATVEAATRMGGARVRVALLDDGDRDEMERMAMRHGARYIRRRRHDGAKAGNINHALGRTDAAFVLVLDCDHVPYPHMLERLLPELTDPRVAYVQAPQYYANHHVNRLAGAAWGQQALFFGPIARGKDAHHSMICCGTNVLFRRAALDDVGGFPQGSLTEDFALSVELHERRWESVYVSEPLAAGFGPEDLAAYISQQHRWARGCLGTIPTILRARLPLRKKAQYLLSASYFLSGWTVALYLALPFIRIVFGIQPLAGSQADTFLAAFAPYFALSLATVASVGAGNYTFAAYSLATSMFWLHLHATVSVITGRVGRFVVTPKEGDTGRQLRAAAPTLVVIAVLTLAAVYGLVRSRDAATLNNVAFAALHVSVLACGVLGAVAPSLATARAPAASDVDAAAA